MSETSVGDLVEALILIRQRARYGLNSDADGARNALERITELCNQALSPSEDTTG